MAEPKTVDGSRDRKIVARALEEIRKKDPRGILHPAAIVSEASAPDHVLHDKFCWDDTEAARAYRLSQAQKLIRMTVTIITPSTQPVRAYVSLSCERPNGYRSTVDVLSEADLRNEMLKDALNDLQAFQCKYQKLSELAPLWKAVRIVKDKITLQLKKVVKKRGSKKGDAKRKRK